VPIHRHAQDQFFGATIGEDGLPKPIDEDLLIQNLFANIPKLCSTDATILSTIHYDTYYGIFEHRRYEEARPMGLMALHPAEDAFHTHPLFDCARNFRHGRIQELFGITFDRYLQLTHPMIEMLTELANEFNQEQIDVASDIEREANKGRGKS
jgi:hypothetical protein